MFRRRHTTPQRLYWSFGLASSLIVLSAAAKWALSGEVLVRLGAKAPVLLQVSREESPALFGGLVVTTLLIALVAVVMTFLGLRRAYLAKTA